MKQVSWRAGGCAAVLLGVMTASAGCTEEETALFIRGVVVVDAPECIASPEGDGVLHSSGLLDVALSPDYEASLIVGSQLTPRGDKTNLRTETMITTVTGAEVRLRRDTGELDTEFTVPATGVLQPEGGNEAGFGIVTATLIPAATGVALAAELNPGETRTRVASIVVFGETIGGLEVESSPYSYVIRVCEGCLVNFPAVAYQDPEAGCVPIDSGEAPASPCRFGQDDAVDCRTCTGGNDFCTFPGGTPP